MTTNSRGVAVWEFLENNNLFSPGFVSKDKKKDVFIAWLDKEDSRIADFGISLTTWRKLLSRNILIDKPKGRDWKVALYLLIGLKRCSGCKGLVSKDTILEGQGRCQPCFQKYRDENADRQNAYTKVHYLNNKQKYLEKAASRRSREVNTSIPEEREAILRFYRECPKGYEVDHIIPLKGKEVSGLHRLCNLQYLTKKDNRAKGNKLLEEYSDN